MVFNMASSKKTRFGGIVRLYGQQAADFFTRSHVTVIGIGGVGSWVAESLARTGIGGLTLIDLDDICITNVNRQIHALSSTVNQSKAYIMAQRIQDINPDCEVNIIDDFVTTNNIAECIADDTQYVVEAIDNAVVKAAIIAYCKRRKIPVLCIGGAGGKIDPSVVQRADLSKTWNDPLLAKVRSQLRSYHGFSRNLKKSLGVDCIYSCEQPKYPDGSGGVTQDKPSDGGGMDCTTGFGSATHITATFAQFAVARVLEKLVKQSTKA
jgi:tRNA A37 threonylcarbamoyladenosine dehydratase